MKNVYVCGDSYFACHDTVPGTHFSEILRDRLGFNLFNLARQGISNAAIRLQVQEAIKKQADLIIIGATDHFRFEVPLHSMFSGQKPKNFLSENGIHNIDYRCQPNLNQHLIHNDQHATLWSDHHSKFNDIDLNPELVKAWKMYVTHLLDMSFKQQVDEWIIESTLTAVMHSGIKFVYMPNAHHVPDWVNAVDVFDLDLAQTYEYPALKINRDLPNYHTTAQDQQDLAARLEPIVRNRLGLDIDK